MSDKPDKIFLGRVFPGPFASQGVDVKLILRGEDVATLISLRNAAKQAKQAGQPLPPGATEYKGEIQLNIRIKASQNGNLYAEIDTYVPDPNRQAPAANHQPARGQTPTVPPARQQPRAEAVVVDESDDLPF